MTIRDFKHIEEMTLREHIQEILDLIDPYSDPRIHKAWNHARAALTAFDEAAELFPGNIRGERTGPTTHRLIPDPDESALSRTRTPNQPA